MKRVLIVVLALLLIIAGGLAGNAFRNARMLAEGASYRFSTTVNPAASASATPAGGSSPSASTGAGNSATIDVSYEAVIAHVDKSTVAQVTNQTTGQGGQAHIARSSGSGYTLTAPDMPSFTIKQSANPFGSASLSTSADEIAAKDKSLQAQHPATSAPSAPASPSQGPTAAPSPSSVARTQILSASPLLANGQLDPGVTVRSGDPSAASALECTTSGSILESFDCSPALVTGAEACWLEPSTGAGSVNILCVDAQPRTFIRYKNVAVATGGSASGSEPIWIETDDGSQYRAKADGALDISSDNYSPIFLCAAGPCRQSGDNVLWSPTDASPHIDTSQGTWRVLVGTVTSEAPAVKRSEAVTKAWVTSGA
ncbi:hypothetical protein FAM15407_000634 [Propionibacterium freudenreichii]|uniref:hypothetical protein n=1 Tax=Propionibacterium freudenreichii TaxID=1744 RepID=UPI00254E67CB|nr:hypothetical protein [Propionibacterium freudenreichii]MDK9657099.1 hypothetical protein [Propionibacterium freudenreichii]